MKKEKTIEIMVVLLTAAGRYVGRYHGSEASLATECAGGRTVPLHEPAELRIIDTPIPVRGDILAVSSPSGPVFEPNRVGIQTHQSTIPLATPVIHVVAVGYWLVP